MKKRKKKCRKEQRRSLFRSSYLKNESILIAASYAFPFKLPKEFAKQIQSVTHTLCMSNTVNVLFIYFFSLIVLGKRNRAT